MREQLIQYVSLLFAGANDCEDIKQEILQNSLDRYDDLISEGKSPEAAYRLAIMGIGDIHELLGQATPPSRSESTVPFQDNPSRPSALRALAVGLYILSAVPLFLLCEMGMSTLGLCGTLFFVAVATVIMILTGKKPEQAPAVPQQPEPSTPEQELRKSIRSMISVVGLAAYFAVSFITDAWEITWLIFPITGAVNGLVTGILDLKEAKNHG